MDKLPNIVAILCCTRSAWGNSVDACIVDDRRSLIAGSALSARQSSLRKKHEDTWRVALVSIDGRGCAMACRS